MYQPSRASASNHRGRTTVDVPWHVFLPDPAADEGSSYLDMRELSTLLWGEMFGHNEALCRSRSLQVCRCRRHHTR